MKVFESTTAYIENNLACIKDKHGQCLLISYKPFMTGNHGSNHEAMKELYLKYYVNHYLNRLSRTINAYTDHGHINSEIVEFSKNIENPMFLKGAFQEALKFSYVSDPDYNNYIKLNYLGYYDGEKVSNDLFIAINNLLTRFKSYLEPIVDSWNNSTYNTLMYVLSSRNSSYKIDKFLHYTWEFTHPTHGKVVLNEEGYSNLGNHIEPLLDESNRHRMSIINMLEILLHYENKFPCVILGEQENQGNEGEGEDTDFSCHMSQYDSKEDNTTQEVDMVNNPPHYKGLPNGLEVIDITQNMDFCLGNALKYILRAGKKDDNPEIQDLKKAVYYLNRKISILEDNN